MIIFLFNYFSQEFVENSKKMLRHKSEVGDGKEMKSMVG